MKVSLAAFFLLKWTLKKDVYKFSNDRMPTCCFWKDNRSFTSGSLLLLYKNGFPTTFYVKILSLPLSAARPSRSNTNFFAIYFYLIHNISIFIFWQVLNTRIMLNRRSQIYEIQKPKANNGGHNRGHTNHNNKPDKMAAGFVATSAASVHSNSFNFSSSASPSSGTSGASATNGNSESHNNLQAVSRKNTKQQPRMGIPIMTSTPRGGQTRTSSTNGKIFLLTLLLK